MAEGQYKFSIGLDNAELARDIQEASKQFQKLVNEVEKAGYKLDDSFKNPFDQFKLPPDLPAKTDAVKAQFNGLNMATQQMVRELPAASMGFNTFFLAISNNLPIFADQVKRVNEENKNLAAQGKPVTSVLKQIGKSLLSWQTALVLGVTALSMYGKEIVSWVTSLFKGKDALDAIKHAENELHDARLQGVADAQEEVTKMQLMVGAMQDATLSMDERTRAMRSLQEQYPEYFGNLSEEEMLYGDLTTSVETLVDRLVKLATARSAVDKLVKNEQDKKLLEGTEGYEAFVSANAAFEAAGRRKRDVVTIGNTVAYVKTSEYRAYDKAQDDLLDNLENGNKEQKALYDKIQDEYDGNVDAYLKANAETNKKLTSEAQVLVTDPGTKAAEEEAKRKKAEEERLAREAEAKRKRADAEAQRTREDISRRTAALAVDAQKAATDATIQAMAEGLEKEKAQINADYDAKEQAITEREEELKKLQGGKLTDAQTTDFASLRASNEAMRANAIAQAEEDATERLNKALRDSIKDMADYYIQYGTLQEKILYITKKYSVLIAEAQTQSQKRALEAERDALLAEYQVAAGDWAKELVDKTTVELNNMLAQLREEVDAKQTAFEALENSNTEDAQALRNQIVELTAKIKYLQSLLNKAGQSVSDDNWAEATQVFQSIASSAREAADDIAGLDENLAYMLRSLADLAGVATNITASFQALSKATNAVEEASAVLAIIGAAIQAISYIANIFNENAEATQRATAALQEYNAELERINNARISESYSNIFGNDKYGEFSARLKAVQEYSKALEDIKNGASKEVDYGWYMTNKEKSDYNLRQAAGGIMDNTTFIADMRSGWQKFWGTGEENIKTTSLDEFYENGVLNVDKLKAYYDTYKEDLTSEQRLLIEELISNGELLQENLDSLNAYLRDKFGQMGQTISDALVDAFRNGTDAAEAMGEAVTDIMEQIAKDMAYSAFIQPLLDAATQQIEDLNAKRQSQGMSDEEYFAQLMRISTTLMDDASDAQEGYNEFMENLRWYAEQNGMDLFGAGGATKDTGIARASQESVDELNGRATAIQSHTYSIMQSQQQLVQDTAQALRYLSHIDDNTRGLKVMQQDMASMRKDINTIVTQGISMR